MAYVNKNGLHIPYCGCKAGTVEEEIFTRGLAKIVQNSLIIV